MLHLNKYKNLAFQKKTETEMENFEDRKFFAATTGFKDYRSSKEPAVVVPMLFRSKSSQPANMESEIEKLKIRQTMRTYGKFINSHVPSQIDSSPVELGQESDKQSVSTDFRSMSLTSLAQVGKSKQCLMIETSFSKMISAHNPEAYNEDAEMDLMRIKSTLSRKSVSVEKGLIYKALAVMPKQETLVTNGMYTAGKDLLSNPFFPKHLFGSKKKKKSKK